MSSAVPSDSTPHQIEYEIITVPQVSHVGREELFKQCVNLRMEVFHVEQGFPAETELDEYEEKSTHFLLRLLPSKEPIGTIRIVPLNDYYKVTRLVVAKRFRKYKLGKALMQTAHDWVIKDALSQVKLRGTTVECCAHSQLYVKGFYGRYGYTPQVSLQLAQVDLNNCITDKKQGPEFIEEGEPHQKMVAQIRIPEERHSYIVSPIE